MSSWFLGVYDSTGEKNETSCADYYPEVKYFPVWLQNRLLSIGLEPVQNIASIYRQFSTNVKKS